MPLQLGSAVRGRRVFHPNGVLARGSLERLAPPGDGLPVDTADVTARVSKAVGLPGKLPDLIGLAIKLPPAAFAATPWDILMVSTWSGPLGRYALRPVTSWQSPMTTLMPVKYEGNYWWVRATMTSDLADGDLALDRISTQLSKGDIEYQLEQSCGTGPFKPLALVRLTEELPSGSADATFDPTIHSAPGVQLAPGWLTDIRRRAYDRSRRGRP
jgi:hypothetical protein